MKYKRRKYADFQKHLKMLHSPLPTAQKKRKKEMYKLHQQLEKLIQGLHKDILSCGLLINTFLDE